jgi:hypothetical protein
MYQFGLNILHVGTNALVTWPTAATNWTLQVNTNLATANWTAFSQLNIGTNGLLRIGTNKPASGNKFFRLIHP